MKSLKDLEAVKNAELERLNSCGTRIVVGMATCGIAAGAKPVMEAFQNELRKRNINGISVSQAGCIGACRLEPLVEVYVPGNEKVTYVKVNPSKAARIVAEHIVNGNPVTEFSVGYYEAGDR